MVFHTADPKIDPNAKKEMRSHIKKFQKRDLKAMDSTAISLCKDSQLVFQLFLQMKRSQKYNQKESIKGENIGTVVSNDNMSYMSLENIDEKMDTKVVETEVNSS